MQIVIEIPEDEYNIIKKSNAPMAWVEHLIANGTPLPKGHGDLIDRDEFHHTLEDMPIRENDKWFNWLQKACNRLAEAPTIIEADRSEEG